MNTYQNNFSQNGREAGTGARIQTPLMARTVTEELTDDFSLPEYKPEIRRMLSVTAEALPAAHYLTPGHAEFAGSIRYCICYEGSDGGVWSAELPSEYDFDLLLDNDPAFDTDGMTAYADVTCESVTARVTAPRRMALRARVRADATVLGMRRLDENVSGGAAVPEGDLCRLTETRETALIARETADAADYSETFLPDDGGNGELRVILCRAEPFVGEVGTTLEGVTVRGELVVNTLLCRDSEGSRPFAVSRRIPFSETVHFDSAPDRAAGCRAWGCVTSAVAEPDENGGVAVTVGLVLTAEVATPATVAYTADIYSLSSESSTVTRECGSALMKKCINSNLTVTGSAELAALGLDGGIRVVDACADVVPSAERAAEGEKFSVCGKLRVHALVDNGAETSGKEFEIPYKYEPDIPGGEQPYSGGGYSEWNLSVPVCRVRVDGEKLTADCELAVSARICSRRKLESVSEVRVGEPRAARGGNITVCYPEQGETLWNVAKRYGIPSADIASENGIEGTKKDTDSLDGVKYLLIR